MTSRIHRAIRIAGDRGATVVEYGLMVAAVAMLILGTVFGLGNLLGSILQNTGTCIAAHGIGDPAQGCPATDDASQPGSAASGG